MSALQRLKEALREGPCPTIPRCNRGRRLNSQSCPLAALTATTYLLAAPPPASGRPRSPSPEAPPCPAPHPPQDRLPEIVEPLFRATSPLAAIPPFGPNSNCPADPPCS
ncbi:hypothetical protein BY996DRAFT_6409235 [Phakopsora pachyrhizi]|nr:hypothetical protein BY996DRAFT_6409235 [Phakopsora pachyrhizi]